MGRKLNPSVLVLMIIYKSTHGFLHFEDLFTFKGIGRPTVKPPTCGFPIKKCDAYSVFRTFDGSCTNPVCPQFGMAGDTYVNIFEPKYEDGTSSPTATENRKTLPLVRNIRTQLFPDGAEETQDGNVLFMAFGQMMAHDISRVLETTRDERCCSESQKYQSKMHRSCYPIHVPDEDTMYVTEGVQCLNFSRAQTDFDLGCKSGYHAKQINSVSAALDLSVIYGSSAEVNYPLRTLSNGQFKMINLNGTAFPPMDQANIPNCRTSFDLGDTRSNQNAALLAVHILLMKQHNRIASALQAINPQWNDARIFHEARRILIAQYQHIAYYEWLPTVISKDTLQKSGIIYPDSPAHVHDFNPNVNPSPSNEYAHAAFVYFHSIIPEYFEFRHKNGTVTNFDWSSNVFCQDFLTQQESLEQLYRGMISQPMASADKLFAKSVTEKFDRQGSNSFGNDLKSIDLQRSRDVGLGSYSDYIFACDGSETTSFEDFEDVIPKEDVDKLKTMYTNPEGVELSVGGTLESHATGSKIGPTFECLVSEQFLRTRVGDYLWFEHSSSGFTTEQVGSIKQTKMSNVMCKNAEGVSRIPLSSFQPPNNENAAADCSTIPDIDFSMWKETA